jgi:phosphopentomutase
VRTSQPPTRVILIVLDSLGVGELPDARAYGDEGSNTVGNIARVVDLRVPVLRRLGLGSLVELGGPTSAPEGLVFKMAERSPGKDSVTGHWELMGVVLDRPFPVFPDGFPRDVVDEFERRIGRPVIGNRAASGTVIVDELGAEHLRTGAPILYTSADSVFQLAAHEEIVPVPELYRFCEIAYELVVEGLGVGRVIARPFVGGPGAFARTGRRHDFAQPPPVPTLLDRMADAGLPVVAIGKIFDLFAGRGIARHLPSASDAEGVDALLSEMGQTAAGLIMVNLVDFDTVYGHRNDPEGYAANLERFDARLSGIVGRLDAGDLLVITADHGNDPTTPSTDHSREFVPVLVTGQAAHAGRVLAPRETFADLGQTLAELFGVPRLPYGTSMLADLLTTP